MNGWRLVAQQLVLFSSLSVFMMATLIDVWAWEMGHPKAMYSAITQEFFQAHPWLRWVVLALVFHLMGFPQEQ